MRKDPYNDLLAFMAVARERSFTRAAAQLGVSQSALSHLIRALEARMGVRLLARTTRSVAPAEAGERLLRGIAPRFQQIEAQLQAVGELRDRPAGTVRINAAESAVEAVIWPKLSQVLHQYPHIQLELTSEARFVDIVTERYDMGVRLGSDLARDMTSVRISPDMRIAIVGSPSYLARHAAPLKPQDLAEHACINLRLMSHGELYAWELEKGRHQVKVRVTGPLVFNSPRPMLNAALAGYGLAYVPEHLALPEIAQGRLCRVLPDWSPAFTGYHLYYASRRHLSRAMAVVIDALRYKPQDP